MNRPSTRGRRPCRVPRLQAGLTLIEMLVSMVILGFVMALVSEAVFQVSQVARAASATTQSLTDRWSAGWAVSDLLANLVAPEGASTDVVMQGSPSRIRGYSTLPLEDTDTGIQPFELALQVDPEDRDRTAMLWTVRSTAGATAASKVVARVSGRAEFVYLRRNGEIVSEWPPLTRTERDAEDLPRAVLLRDASSGRHLLWYDCPGEPIRPRPVRNPFEVTP